jgi:hypothetical protein
MLVATPMTHRTTGRNGRQLIMFLAAYVPGGAPATGGAAYRDLPRCERSSSERSSKSVPRSVIQGRRAGPARSEIRRSCAASTLSQTAEAPCNQYPP